MNTRQRASVALCIAGAMAFAHFEIWMGTIGLGLVAVCSTIDYCVRSR